MSGVRGGIPLIFGLTRGILSGVDVFVAALVRWLGSQGHDARILLTASDITGAAAPFDVLETSPDWDWHRRWSALREYLARRSPCIFVANYDTEYSIGLLPPPANMRIVLTVQSDDPQHYGHVLMIGHVADRIVAVSTAIAEHIGVIAPALKTRTVVIPNGVDLPSRPPRPRDTAVRPLRAVYAGRIVAKQKNVPDLVRVSAGIDAIESLTLIGEGSAEPSVVFWSMLHGSDLRLVPTLPHASLAEQYESHDIALLHSSYEGLPLMVLEAMSHGCIPICRFVRSGLPELIEHGTNGFFYDSADDLAAICSVLSHDGQARLRIAAAAYETIVARERSTARPYARYATLFGEVARGMATSPWTQR